MFRRNCLVYHGQAYNIIQKRKERSYSIQRHIEGSPRDRNKLLSEARSVKGCDS